MEELKKQVKDLTEAIETSQINKEDYATKKELETVEQLAKKNEKRLDDKEKEEKDFIIFVKRSFIGALIAGIVGFLLVVAGLKR